jgi:hypothetical protein
MKRFILSLSCIATMVLGANVVSAQDYPNKPMRIVTTQVGGASMAQSRASDFQQLTIINRSKLEPVRSSRDSYR